MSNKNARYMKKFKYNWTPKEKTNPQRNWIENPDWTSLLWSFAFQPRHQNNSLEKTRLALTEVLEQLDMQTRKLRPYLTLNTDVYLIRSIEPSGSAQIVKLLEENGRIFWEL